MVHVVPMDDYIEHDDSTVCVCEPIVEFNNEILVIHNALDDRIDGDGQQWGVFTEQSTHGTGEPE